MRPTRHGRRAGPHWHIVLLDVVADEPQPVEPGLPGEPDRHTCLAGEAMRITGEVVWNPALTPPGAQ